MTQNTKTDRLGYMSVETLYIDPDLGSRLRFKQAAASSGIQVAVSVTTTLSEALQRLDNQRGCDLIYLVSRFGRDVIERFVNTAKRTRHGKNASFMLVLQGPVHDAAELAKYAMSGADAFLLEPYSAHSLEETVQIGLKLKEKRASYNQKLAMTLLVNSLIDGVNANARCLKQGRYRGNALRDLKSSAQILESFSPEILNEYFTTLIRKLTLSTHTSLGPISPHASKGLDLPRRVIQATR